MYICLLCEVTNILTFNLATEKVDLLCLLSPSQSRQRSSFSLYILIFTFMPFPSLLHGFSSPTATLSILLTSSQLVNYLVSRVWLQVPESMKQRMKNPWWFTQRILVQRPQEIIKGHSGDVVIHYIWHYKIITHGIKMIILLKISIIAHMKSCWCIFSHRLSSLFIDSGWL